MIKKLIAVLIFLVSFFYFSLSVSAQRYAVCDQCGYCPENPPPQNWEKCRQCLYPNTSNNPALKETLLINPRTNLPPTPYPGRMYTFLGCLGGEKKGFTEKETVGSVTQAILNIIFSIVGGVAFLYFLYGSFIIATSQADPEKLNYGKRLITGSIVGLIFSLSSILIISFITNGVLKLPF